jgi:hypothetical protein
LFKKILNLALVYARYLPGYGQKEKILRGGNEIRLLSVLGLFQSADSVAEAQLVDRVVRRRILNPASTLVPPLVETLFGLGLAFGTVLGMLSAGKAAEIAPHCAYLPYVLIPEMAQELTPPFKEIKGISNKYSIF